MELIITNRKGKAFTIFYDDEDHKLISRYNWFVVEKRNTSYVRRDEIINGKRMLIYMHRELLGIDGTKLFGDHRDRNGLNNRRDNLRIATHAQNQANSKSRKNSTSKYLGVHWNSYTKSWKVEISKNCKTNYIGRFKTEEDAALAYNNAAKILHGEFANLNNV